MGHAYAHLWNLPTTMFRFFTVYGPWGRPDMAYFKFAEAISKDQPIDLYNRGDLYRDFTYVDDLVRGIRLLIDAVPPRPEARGDAVPGDSLSPLHPTGSSTSETRRRCGSSISWRHSRPRSGGRRS